MGHQVEAETKTPVVEGLEVMAQNIASFRVWKACETQWRVISGMGGTAWLGLDYNAVDVVLRRAAVAEPDEVFADLMDMEAEALAAFAEVER
jgi:hypothetical protein